MKKMLLLLATLLLLLGSTTALADTYRFGTVANSSSVNLRRGASKQTERLGSYKRGTWLRILDDYGDWYKVKGPDGKTGYMMKEYIYISAGAMGVVGIVDVSDSLNLRSKANGSGKIIGAYPDGVPCILLSETGDWYHVSVDGKAGYFNSDYIDKKYMAYSTDVCTVVNPSGKNVNLRKGPGTDYSVVKSIKSGSYGMIIQEGTDWWKICVNGTVGYMMTDYLEDGIVGKSSGSSSSGDDIGSSSGGYALVDTGRLHLRKSASKASRSLGTYPRGTYVTILEQGGTWCKVKVDGTTGYMMSEFLAFYGMSSTALATVVHPDGGSYVNLRNGPSQSTGDVIRRVPDGSDVIILTPGKTWSKIEYNGITGYMMTRFLQD